MRWWDYWRVPQQKGGVLSEGILFELLSGLDFTKHYAASDKSEGEMEHSEADEQMGLEEETTRFEVAVQWGDGRTSFQASKEEKNIGEVSVGFITFSIWDSFFLF